MATLAERSDRPAAGRARLPLRRALGAALPHAILILFSAAILLPLLWVFRVSLTDKLTAYQDPAGVDTPQPRQLRRDLHRLRLRDLVHQQPGRGARLDRDRAAARDRDGLCLRALQHRRLALRLGVLASQMLPPVILVLPLFTLFLTAGLLNTRIALITAHLAINVPFLAWMLVASSRARSKQLEEAARVEGATRFQAFVRIAVPVAAPGILAAGLLGFILSWNEFLFALILSGKQTQTLPVGLSALETHRGRRDRAARRRHAVRGAAGLRLAAVPAEISDQGAIARRPQMTPRGLRERNMRKLLCSASAFVAARRRRPRPRPSTS